MTHDDLTTVLARTADDRDRPLETDLSDLLERARAGRARARRRAGVGMAAGAAVLTAAVVLGATTLRPAAEPPAPAGPGPGITGQTDSFLGSGEMVRRCQPQLDKYAAYPMYATHPAKVPWQPVHPDRGYRAGDLVLLRAGDPPKIDQNGMPAGGSSYASNPVFCQIPRAGAENAPVPFSAYTATAAQTDRLRQVCSEQAGSTDQGAPGATTPDLRHADVAAADTVGAVTMALLHQGSHFYSCAVTPVTWDAGIAESGTAYPGELSFAGGTTGASHKSIVTESAAWITVAAHVDTAAKTLQLSWPGGPTEQFPVTDGNVAAVFRVPTTGGLQSCDYRLLDGSGRVLKAGTTG